jgi:RND family efflux transporter MFP subunit
MGHAVVLLGLLGLGACGQEPTPQRQPPPVTVANPEIRTIQRYALFTGSSRAVEMADVVARIPGRLETVEFEPGHEVERGEVLFTIEREAYVAARDAAAASVKSAEAELLRAQTELNRVERASQNNAVSEMDLDTARASRDKADAAVLSARADLADAELRLSYTQVRSPIDGVVGRNLVDAGNLVGQSGPTLLTTVNKIQPMYVYFHAPEGLVLEFLHYISELEAAGMTRDDRAEVPAFVELANEEGYPHEGFVDFVNNTVDPNTGTIEMRVRLANEDHLLFPGLFVRVKVVGGEIPDAVLVPETAVGSDLGGKYVLVVGENNIVEQRYVGIGLLQDDGSVQIAEGLEGDETVIVNGLMFARPGLPVTPLTAEQFQQMMQQGAR